MVALAIAMFALSSRPSKIAAAISRGDKVANVPFPSLGPDFVGPDFFENLMFGL
jgi:hypothetical protein